MARITRNKGLIRLQPKTCLCGCQELLKIHKYLRSDGVNFWYSINDFIKGHRKRGIEGFNSEVHSPRICLCGCGLYTNKFRGKLAVLLKDMKILAGLHGIKIEVFLRQLEPK